MTRQFHWLAIVVFGAASGCGEEDGLRRVHIVGKLTAKGVPVDNCVVLLVPNRSAGTKGIGAGGETDSTGTFKVISSRAGAQGLPPGEYKVVLNRWIDSDGAALPADAKQADYPNAVQSIPAKYTAPETTTLRVTIPEAGGEVNIDIPEGLVGRRSKKR